MNDEPQNEQECLQKHIDYNMTAFFQSRRTSHSYVHII